MIRRDFRIFRRDILTELSQVVQVRASPTRPERAEALSPGHRPGYDGNQQDALKGQKLYVLSGIFKAFALTGRQVCVRNYPGRCPGLRASALSGRMGQNLRKFSFFIILKRTNYDRRQKLREGRARHALLSHRYPQGSAQPAGEMDQPVSRAQAEPLFGLRRQVFPLLHPATSSRNHRISG